ncbi:transposase [Staphylococcus capitis]|uniref:transposase n=1 Tax=Staphylococcus capitis TaxID=29388 RepID=UPI003CFDD60A
MRRVSCLCGVSTLTAFALVVEIGDWNPFTGNTIGSFLGLVRSEYSSGSSQVLGAITKSGNTHARRLLGEAARHHRPRFPVRSTRRSVNGSRWQAARVSCIPAIAPSTCATAPLRLVAVNPPVAQSFSVLHRTMN